MNVKHVQNQKKVSIFKLWKNSLVVLFQDLFETNVRLAVNKVGCIDLWLLNYDPDTTGFCDIFIFNFFYFVSVWNHNYHMINSYYIDYVLTVIQSDYSYSLNWMGLIQTPITQKQVGQNVIPMVE